jgi:lysophospholipase L1-like esterase
MLLVAWVGFFFPDPYYVNRSAALHRQIMWAGRVGVPLLLLALGILDKRIRQRRADRRVPYLLGGGLVLGALLAYPPLSYLHERSFERGGGRAHPYLQLDPPLYQPRPRSDGPTPLRIFCLGGSTTEWVDSGGRGWPERVEATLRDSHPATPVEMHNLGRQWYTTLHALINYETNLRHHRPDVLLVMHVINDVLHNADFSYFSRGPFRDDYGHFYGPLQRLSRPESFPRHIAGLFAAVWYHRPRIEMESHDFPGLKPFDRNLRTLIALARMDETVVVLMTEPNLYRESMPAAERSLLHLVEREAVGPDRRWSFATAHRAMLAYNDAVRRIAREENVALIDLDAMVAKTPEYFKDDVHYRDPAFDVVAAGVARGLEPTVLSLRADSTAR